MLLAGLACTEKKEAPAEVDAAEPAAKQEPSLNAPPAAGEDDAEPLPPLPDPVAKVGDHKIGREAFQARFDEVLSRYRRANTPLRSELKRRLRANLLRRLIEAEVIRQKAVELKVEPDAEAIETAWAAHKKSFGGEDGFEAFAQRSGSSPEGLRAAFIENLRRSRVIEAGVSSKAPTVAEMRAFYESHPGYFDRPPEVRVRQILFPIGTADGKEKAKSALEKLRSGASFETVHAEFAPDPADPRKGDLGFLPRHRFPEPVAKAAFDELEAGQLSGVIESPYGLHIVRKVAERPERTLDFDEARSIIEQRMTAQRRNRDVREALEKWKKAAEIEVFTDDDVSGPPRIQPGLIAPPKIDAPAALELNPASVRPSRTKD